MKEVGHISMKGIAKRLVEGVVGEGGRKKYRWEVRCIMLYVGTKVYCFVYSVHRQEDHSRVGCRGNHGKKKGCRECVGGG